MTRKSITQAEILAAVEDAVYWSGGIGWEWKGDALISSSLLLALVKLAAKAPLSEKKKVFE